MAAATAMQWVPFFYRDTYSYFSNVLLCNFFPPSPVTLISPHSSMLTALSRQLMNAPRSNMLPVPFNTCRLQRAWSSAADMRFSVNSRRA